MCFVLCKGGLEAEQSHGESIECGNGPFWSFSVRIVVFCCMKMFGRLSNSR